MRLFQYAILLWILFFGLLAVSYFVRADHDEGKLPTGYTDVCTFFADLRANIYRDFQRGLDDATIYYKWRTWYYSKAPGANSYFFRIHYEHMSTMFTRIILGNVKEVTPEWVHENTIKQCIEGHGHKGGAGEGSSNTEATNRAPAG